MDAHHHLSHSATLKQLLAQNSSTQELIEEFRKLPLLTSRIEDEILDLQRLATQRANTRLSYLKRTMADSVRAFFRSAASEIEANIEAKLTLVRDNLQRYSDGLAKDVFEKIVNPIHNLQKATKVLPRLEIKQPLNQKHHTFTEDLQYNVRHLLSAVTIRFADRVRSLQVDLTPTIRQLADTLEAMEPDVSAYELEITSHNTLNIGDYEVTSAEIEEATAILDVALAPAKDDQYDTIVNYLQTIAASQKRKPAALLILYYILTGVSTIGLGFFINLTTPFVGKFIQESLVDATPSSNSPSKSQIQQAALQLEMANPSTIRKHATKVHVRPDTKSPVKHYLPKALLVRRIQKHGCWAQIEYLFQSDDDTVKQFQAWVDSKYLQPIRTHMDKHEYK